MSVLKRKYFDLDPSVCAQLKKMADKLGKSEKEIGERAITIYCNNAYRASQNRCFVGKEKVNGKT